MKKSKNRRWVNIENAKKRCLWIGLDEGNKIHQDLRLFKKVWSFKLAFISSPLITKTYISEIFMISNKELLNEAHAG